MQEEPLSLTACLSLENSVVASEQEKTKNEINIREEISEE